jgi:hypothetical protein
MKKLAVIAVTLILTACASAIPETPEYWVKAERPIHKTVEVQVVNRGWALYCKHPGALACADPFEKKDRCMVYINAKATPRAEYDWVIDHEKCHCVGYDHPQHMKRGPGYLHQLCPADTHLMPHTFTKPTLEN